MEIRSERGFTMLEAFLAMSIMLVALLALAQVLYASMAVASTSTPALVAREKAREAIESVHTARDTFTTSWAQIRNVSAPGDCPAGTTASGGGIFLNAERTVTASGTDGLVNTADDSGVEKTPGQDGVLGTADDVPLVGFTRQVQICDVNGTTDLRQIVVTIRYNGSSAVGERRRTYRLVTLISRFS